MNKKDTNQFTSLEKKIAKVISNIVFLAYITVQVLANREMFKCFIQKKEPSFYSYVIIILGISTAVFWIFCVVRVLVLRQAEINRRKVLNEVLDADLIC